jgi:tRNA threonylcarbamoyl adenosine modification protein (Sua5/YciO/YrdC/YwlC family)
MPELVKLRPGELPGREALHRAAEAARRGEVVAFPTDTVYGLGTSALSREGVARLYRIKGRSPDKPLPLLVDSIEAAGRWVVWTPSAQALARRFWPGGLTLVLKASAAGRELANVQGETVAVRVPDHPVTLALLEASQAPWAQTSANESGQPPLADGSAVARRFAGALAMAIDSGAAVGRESSVVDATCEPPRMLREGLIPASAILAAAEPPRRWLFVCTGNSCRSVMAEFLLGRLARRRGLELSARSCGVAADPGFSIPAGVRAALRARGIEEVQHVPTPVSRELLDWAETVLVMEARQRSLLLGLFPDCADKVHTLNALAGLPGPEDVADPIGRSDAVYSDCCLKIQTALETILGLTQEESKNAPHPAEPRS